MAAADGRDGHSGDAERGEVREDGRPPRLRITRETLGDGSLLAEVRANAPPGMRILSDQELQTSLETTLRGAPAGEDIWLFGYGSLMWNPVIACDAMEPALLHGWRRSFCLNMLTGRGSPEQPGVMLALDRGGACWGLGLRISAAIAHEELMLVWRREMFGGSYDARWVSVRAGGRTLRAITFTVNRAGPRYLGQLPEAEIAHRIARASGPLGTCREYLLQTSASLAAHELSDGMVARLHRMVDLMPGPT